MTGDEVVEVGRVGQHVVGDEQVGLSVFRDNFAGRSSAEEPTTVGMPLLGRRGRTFAAGSIPSAGSPRRRSAGASNRRCSPPRPRDCRRRDRKAVDHGLAT